MKALFAFFLLTICFSLPCRAAEAATDSAKAEKLKIAVSIAPQKYFVEKLAGDYVDVTVMVKPGSDPHSYEPSPAQMRQFNEAAIYFSIGVPFEEVWLPRMENSKVVSMIRDIERRGFADGEQDQHGEENHEGHNHEHHGEETHDGHDHGRDNEDPHVWLSTEAVAGMLPVLTQTLSAKLPEHKAEIEANAERFQVQLENLNIEITNMLAEIPEQRRVFLTFHPSWGYFADEFKLKELSIEIDGKEPGPRAMKEVIDTARAYGLNTIFIEPQFSKAAAKAVAENIDAKVVEIDPLAEDWMNNLRRTAELIAESCKR